VFAKLAPGHAKGAIVGDDDAAGVADDVMYQQAMETFRGILAQVVSTAGVFATAALTIVAVAVERDSPALVGVAGAFPLAIHLLFRRWRRFDAIVLPVAAAKEVGTGPRLATDLSTWRSDAWFVNDGPLTAAGGLIGWAIVWAVI
jgi:hypothetical protein